MLINIYQAAAGDVKKGFSDAEKAELKEAFGCFDKDGSGSITLKELGVVLNAMSNRKFTGFFCCKYKINCLLYFFIFPLLGLGLNLIFGRC